MKKGIFQLLLFVFFAACWGLSANAQTISNPDFEFWPAGCPYNTAPYDWTNYTVGGLGPDQAGNCAGTVTSQQGRSHMNLVWSQTRLYEGASQTITGFTAGNCYSIEFHAIHSRGLYALTDPVVAQVFIDGTIIFTTPDLILGGAWAKYTASFIASSNSHTIAFRVNQGSSGSTGSGSIGIDNVSIKLVTSTPTQILARDTCLQSGSNFSLSNGVQASSWNFGDPASGANNFSTVQNPRHTFSAAGNYTITVTINRPCKIDTLTYPINIVECIDTCTGSIIKIGDTCIQTNHLFAINANSPIVNVIWNFGDPSSGANNISNLNNPVHTFSALGSYLVTAIVNFTCGTDTLYITVNTINCDSADKDCRLFIPNAFTPNLDNINQQFFSLKDCQPEQYELRIFNRWGKLIFKTSNHNEKWDGKMKGVECSEGVYAYSLIYKFPRQQYKNMRGTITLLR